MLSPTVFLRELGNGNVDAVAPVSTRSSWQRGVPIAGTVNTVVAAAETLTAGAIFAADTGSSLKVIQVPPGCTYLELGAFGDNAAIGAAPVIEVWRSCGNKAGLAVADVWSQLRNVLGSQSITLSGAVQDTTGTAGTPDAPRYTVEEGTYQQNLFDVRGGSLVVIRVTTIGTTGDWSLFHRFI